MNNEIRGSYVIYIPISIKTINLSHFQMPSIISSFLVLKLLKFGVFSNTTYCIIVPYILKTLN